MLEFCTPGKIVRPRQCLRIYPYQRGWVETTNLGDSSEYLSIVGLKNVLILHFTLVSFSIYVILLLIVEHCFALKFLEISA